MEHRRKLGPIFTVATLLALTVPPERPPARREDEPEPGPELAPGEVLCTVPWDPEADGAHVRGKVVRAVVRAGEIAIENGWSAAALQNSPRWHDMSLRAACVRQAVKWGLVP